MSGYHQQPVGFGVSAPTAQVHISPRDPNIVGLLIQPSDVGTQVEDLFDVENASGTSLFKIDKDGIVTLSTLMSAGGGLILQESTPVNAVAATGVQTRVTSEATVPASGSRFVIGAKTYRFMDVLAVEGDILITASASATLLNLERAIMHTGTADTDYKCAVASTQVSAGSAAATTLTLLALVKGVSGNSIITSAGTTPAANITPEAATLAGGIDGTVGIKGEVRVNATYLYVASAANTVADTNWRRMTLGSTY